MTVCHLDFETRSGADLKDFGAHLHVTHEWAGMWCIGYAFDDEPVTVIQPTEAGLFLYRVLEEEPLFVAHNAQFEWQVWNSILTRYGFPKLPIERFRCTMAAGYAMSLPGSLDDMSAALGIAEGKDMVGHRLAVQMAKPRAVENGGPVWWDTPEKRERLEAYCKQDVVLEREVYKRLRPLPEAEQRIWCLDAAINERGVFVDEPAAKTALAVVQRQQVEECAKVWHLTGGEVNGPSEVKRLTEWITAHGVDIPSLAKQDIIDTLATVDMPPLTREVIEIRQTFAKTSTAKVDRMISNRGRDGRLRGLFQYHAANTGRWGGRRIQPHNLPRPTIEQTEIEEIITALSNSPSPEAAQQYISVFHGPPLARVADCLRGLLRAEPGKKLYAGDFANIEGRVLAWLAGEVWKLEAFRAFDAGTGPDLYLVSASRIYRKPVESYNKKSPERQIGKTAELALGYQGGVGAFQSMAKNYGCRVSDAEADGIKVAWRNAHPATKRYWYDLEAAAVQAIDNPGLTFQAGASYAQVRFRVVGSFLWCAIPSGRALCYPYPHLEEYESEWGLKKEIRYKSVGLNYQWGVCSTYGGSLAENITQAVARDVLAEAMMRIDANGWPIVLHVHDEIVAEAVSGNLDEYLSLMKLAPTWAAGLPIAVEGWTGVHYRK